MDDPNIAEEMEWGNKKGKNYFMVLHFSFAERNTCCTCAVMKVQKDFG
jgi:hypothetical protein